MKDSVVWSWATGPHEFLECYGENWFCFLRLFFDKTDHSNCSDNDPMHNDLKSRHSDFYVILFDMICQNNPQNRWELFLLVTLRDSVFHDFSHTLLVTLCDYMIFQNRPQNRYSYLCFIRLYRRPGPMHTHLWVITCAVFKTVLKTGTRNSAWLHDFRGFNSSF